MATRADEKTQAVEPGGPPDSARTAPKGVAPTTAPIDAPPPVEMIDEQALIKEARRHQRRRYRWIAVVLVLALVGTGVGLSASRGTGAPAKAPRRSVLPAAPVPCKATELNAQGGRQGGGFGEAAGLIEFTDTGAKPCMLQGVPILQLMNAAGQALAVPSGSRLSTATVQLDPGGKDHAYLIVYWDNWCGSAPGPLTMRIALTNGGRAVLAPFDGPPYYNYVPLCTRPGQASTLQVVSGFHSGP